MYQFARSGEESKVGRSVPAVVIGCVRDLLWFTAPELFEVERLCLVRTVLPLIASLLISRDLHGSVFVCISATCCHHGAISYLYMLLLDTRG